MGVFEKLAERCLYDNVTGDVNDEEVASVNDEEVASIMLEPGYQPPARPRSPNRAASVSPLPSSGSLLFLSLYCILITISSLFSL